MSGLMFVCALVAIVIFAVIFGCWRIVHESREQRKELDGE